MSQAFRKILSSFLILLLIIVYSLLATAFAAANLGESGGLVHLIYFFLTGILWIFPAMMIVRWAMIPGNSKRRERKD